MNFILFDFLGIKNAPQGGSVFGILLLAGELDVAVAAAECCHFAGRCSYASAELTLSVFGRLLLLVGLNFLVCVVHCHHVLPPSILDCFIILSRFCCFFNGFIILSVFFHLHFLIFIFLF